MAIQILVAVDQLVNTLLWDKVDGFGYADETISARAWRLREVSKPWATFQRLVDLIFFWDENHCEKSWISEVRRKQFPANYRVK